MPAHMSRVFQRLTTKLSFYRFLSDLRYKNLFVRFVENNVCFNFWMTVIKFFF